MELVKIEEREMLAVVEFFGWIFVIGLDVTLSYINKVPIEERLQEEE